MQINWELHHTNRVVVRYSFYYSLNIDYLINWFVCKCAWNIISSTTKILKTVFVLMQICRQLLYSLSCNCFEWTDKLNATTIIDPVSDIAEPVN